jgi:hypothetical protein
VGSNSNERYAASIAHYHRAAQAPNPLALKVATDALKRITRARSSVVACCSARALLTASFRRVQATPTARRVSGGVAD